MTWFRIKLPSALSYLLATIGVLFFSASLAFAQGPPVSGMDEVIVDATPVTGSLMAAALETAGYAAQAQVLEHLGFMFESLGALIYVVLLIGAFISVAMYGSYEGAAWLLIGPTLFYFLLNTRQVGYGAEWQWAVPDSTSTEEFAEAIGEIQNPQGKVLNNVSWLFDEYNKLVSNFILQGIQIILNNDVNARIKPMARQRVLDHMFSAEIGSANLKTLIHLNYAYCGDVMQYMRTKALGERHPQFRTSPSYSKSVLEIEKLGAHVSPKITIKKYSAAYTALEEIFRDYTDRPTEAAGQGFPNSDAFTSCKVPDEVPPVVSCQQIWCWMAKGLQTEVQHVQKSAEGKYMAGTDDEALKQSMWEDIVVKLSDPKLLEEGDNTKYLAPDLSLIPVILGGHMMRKELGQGIHSLALGQFGENSGYRQGSFEVNMEKMNVDQLQEFIRRFKKEYKSEPERWRVYTLALYMPYLQGVILYVLGLTFPFFALMILIPGQASGFLQWMGLWFWVKFWDFGWAMIVVVDDILWELMPHSAKYDVLKDPNDSPITYFDTAFASDPSYTLGMYYAIIGVMITGVPVVTAQFVMGSKAAIVNTLIDGMNQLAEKWGRAAGNAVAVESSRGLEKLRMDHAMNWKVNSPQSRDNAQRLEAAASQADSLASELEGDAMAMAAGAAGMAAGSMTMGAMKQFFSSGSSASLASGSAGAAFRMYQGSLKARRQAQSLRFSAFKVNETERLAASARTRTEINLQGALGSTRDRIGHWFSRGSAAGVVGDTNSTVANAKAILTSIRAEAYSSGVSDVVKGKRS